MKKINKENLFFIDSIRGFNLAIKSYNPSTDILVTDNPFIVSDPITKNYVKDISIYLSQEDANKIGKNVLLMSDEIERVFIKNNYKNIFNYFSKKIGLYLAIGPLLNVIIEKALTFNIFFKNYSIKKLHFFINKSEYYDDNNPWSFPRFSNVYKFLAQNLFFSNIPCIITELEINEPEDINNTIEKNLILRIITWPLSYILYKIFNLINFKFKNENIFYLRTCETLNETIAKFYFKGYKIRALSLPKTSQISIESIDQKKTILSNDIGTIINNYLSLFFNNEAEINAQQDIILDHILQGMIKLNVDTQLFARYFSELGHIKSILTAGFYGPISNQLFYLCKKYKINLIGFEHGVTAGINKDVSEYINNLESTTCDLLMVSNLAAKKEFDRANLSNEESRNNKVYVIGEAEQKKNIYLYKLQRYFLMKRYNLRKKDDMIVHVSGVLFNGNFKIAPTSAVTNYAFSREKNLLTNVYNKINKKVLYKKYPSQRLLHQPCYSEILKLSSNITMVEQTDFRYIRTVANIIVTDSNYSTLGWCLVKDIPLVYLMSRQSQALISKQLEGLFKEAFLVVDIDKIGWELELQKILNFSMHEIKKIWDIKNNKRTFLVENFIHGPSENSSNRAVNYIINNKLL